MHEIKKNVRIGSILVSTILVLAAAGVPVDRAAAQAPATPAGPTPAPTPAPAAPTSPLIGPALAGSLTIPLPPPKLTLPLLGNIYLDGIGSGLGQWQNNPFAGNRALQPDLSNGQLFLQKTDGVFQFYTQFGAYSIAALGAPYVSAATATFGTGGLPATGNLWGWFPMGFAKIVPNDTFSIEGGKLPSPIGAEDAFSFQNIDIERGLLWNQEPSIGKGGQLNYTKGPVTLALQFSDGFDSGVYNYLSGSVTYTINSTNTFVFSAGAMSAKPTFRRCVHRCRKATPRSTT